MPILVSLEEPYSSKEILLGTLPMEEPYSSMWRYPKFVDQAAQCRWRIQEVSDQKRHMPKPPIDTIVVLDSLPEDPTKMMIAKRLKVCASLMIFNRWEWFPTKQKLSRSIWLPTQENDFPQRRNLLIECVISHRWEIDQYDFPQRRNWSTAWMISHRGEIPSEWLPTKEKCIATKELMSKVSKLPQRTNIVHKGR